MRAAFQPAEMPAALIELLRGETQAGYGLHLFQPEWFDPDRDEPKPFRSPTVVPEVNVRDIISDDLKNVCSDDALWLVPAVVEYIKETGESRFWRKRLAMRTAAAARCTNI